MAVAARDVDSMIELLADRAVPQEQSRFKVLARRFARHRLAVICLGLLLIIFLVSLFAKEIAPYGPTEIDVGNTFASPFSRTEDGAKAHLLGTDHLGRDYFSRLLYAARISLTVAFSVVAGSITIGAIVGAVSGFYGGVLDDALMRVVEFLLTIPTLPILLILSSILIQTPEAIPVPQALINLAGKVMYISPRESQQVIMIIIVLMSFSWLSAARLMRGMVLSIKHMDYVEASRALGVSNSSIILRHMIPNSMAPMIVAASLGLADIIITEAALSFIGFGIQDPTPTWGNMLSFTQSHMFNHPWLPLVPGTPIFICALAFNFVGDGLRDALDPRLKL